MQALRAHPFFAKFNWEALWTCAAPTLEPGLFKKDPTPERKDNGIRWEDIGTVWDEVVASDIEQQPGTGEDGIAWASDAEASPITRVPNGIQPGPGPSVNGSVDKLGQAIENMTIDRGRNRAVTPLSDPENFQIDPTDL
jgi:hypothetical protein